MPKSEQSSFALREFKLPAFASPWHFHPEIELTYIVSSCGKRFIGDHIAPFGPGDLVLVGANLPHFWHNDTPPSAEAAPAHSVVIQFREDCLGKDFFSRPELSDVQRLLHAANRGLQFTGATRNAVASTMLDMRRHSGLDLLLDLLHILKLLLQAVEPRPLSSAGFVPCLDERAGERINRAFQHIFRNFAHPLDREEVAHEAGMSLSAFCHYFKGVTGRTLTDFITEVRIGHARRLLIETEDPIAQIAFASGFETVSNFNRCFQNLTKTSPRRYRREHRKLD